MNARSFLAGVFIVVGLLTEGTIAISCSRTSSVTLLARGPAGVRIEGKGSDIAFEQDASAVTFSVPLAPLDTGMTVRDLQMRQALETSTYPVATLRIPRSALTYPREHAPVDGAAAGDLTLHGHTRPVKVHYHAEMGPRGVAAVRGSMRLDMREFDINPPSYFGISLAPIVEVTAELTLPGHEGAMAAATGKAP